MLLLHTAKIVLRLNVIKSTESYSAAPMLKAKLCLPKYVGTLFSKTDNASLKASAFVMMLIALTNVAFVTIKADSARA